MARSYLQAVAQNQAVLLADQLYELAENFERAYDKEKNSREQFFELEVSGVLGPVLRNIAQYVEMNKDSRNWKKKLEYDIGIATWFNGDFDVTEFFDPRQGSYSEDTKRAFSQMMDIDRKFDLGLYEKLLKSSKQHR